MMSSNIKIESPCPLWKDYEILDSGNGEKLERFGRHILIRPEPKALWDKTLSEDEWSRKADCVFVPGAGFAKAGKEDSGSWKKARGMEDNWNISYNLPAGAKINLKLALTSFKHVGVFPEQAPNWDYIFSNTKKLAEINSQNGLPAPKVLNLFAYTGAASIAARAAGADVTHLDSVRQVVSWANGNMTLSGLKDIRWVVEDAMKFAAREHRRGNTYQGIILDPPAYGHGPDGEKWKLDECLFELLKSVSAILAPKDSFVVLNLYSNGYSAALARTILREAFSLKGSEYDIEVGELALKDSFDKVMPLSVFVRLAR